MGAAPRMFRQADREAAARVERKLDALGILLTALGRQLATLTTQEATIMGAQDDLKAAVAANTTVIGSAITLIQGLKAKLDEAIASGDPAALKALSDQLGADDQALAAAVTANTPAA